MLHVPRRGGEHADLHRTKERAVRGHLAPRMIRRGPEGQVVPERRKSDPPSGIRQRALVGGRNALVVGRPGWLQVVEPPGQNVSLASAGLLVRPAWVHCQQPRPEVGRLPPVSVLNEGRQMMHELRLGPRGADQPWLHVGMRTVHLFRCKARRNTSQAGRCFAERLCVGRRRMRVRRTGDAGRRATGWRDAASSLEGRPTRVW